MLDLEHTTICKGCGCTIADVGKPPHQREYHNDACKQRHYRQEKARKDREAREQEMSARWTGLLPETQQVLEDVLQSYGPMLASRVAVAIRSEITAAVQTHRQNAETSREKLELAGARVRKLEQQVEVQRQRLAEYYQQVHNGAQPDATPAKTAKQPAWSEGLSPGLVSWHAFANLHRVPQNEVRARISRGFIHVVKGNWKVDNGRVKEALDEEGQREFWVQFHTEASFAACDDCPHVVKIL